jgi:hypothetical protein
VLDETGAAYSATLFIRQIEVKMQIFHMLFAVIVLTLMLFALVNYYPGT